MLISRNLSLLRTVLHYNAKKSVAQNLLHIRRHGHITWSYRVHPGRNKKSELLADIVGGVMWWWIFWRLYHDYEELGEEFPYPDTDKWTDEELGIPPDNFDG